MLMRSKPAVGTDAANFYHKLGGMESKIAREGIFLAKTHIPEYKIVSSFQKEIQMNPRLNQEFPPPTKQELVRFGISVLAFASTLPFSLIPVALVWSFTTCDRLYHCWDFTPIVSFIPPFVHPEATGYQGDKIVQLDYYIWPEWSVYLVWLCFVAVAFSFPAFVARKVFKDGTKKH